MGDDGSLAKRSSICLDCSIELFSFHTVVFNTAAGSVDATVEVMINPPSDVGVLDA